MANTTLGKALGAPTTINKLHPYHMAWILEGRVIRKGTIHDYNNAKGEGQILNFNVIDTLGDDINVTCFGKAAAFYHAKIQEGTIYRISKGTLKYVKVGYRDSSSPWEIMLGMDSILEICTEPTTCIPTTAFHFTPISAIQQMPLGTTVDVIGAVTFWSEISKSTRKDGSSTQHSTITIKDHTGYCITITLWGVLCDEANQILQPQHDQPAVEMPILAVRKAKTTEFRGRTLTSAPSTQLFVTPAVPEIESLQIWLTTTEASTSATPLSTQAPVEKKIVDIHACTSPNANEQIVTIATIIHLNMENYCYPACSRVVNNKQCQKKLITGPDSTWHCSKCNLSTTTCDYRYALHMMVEDRTGTIWVTNFDDVALTLLGVPANALKEQTRSIDDLWNIIKQVLFHTYRFIFFVTPSTYKGKEQLSCTVHNMTPVEQDIDHTELVAAFLDGTE
ncbi:hypothetical protein KI387_040610 [Taxus chinensis]|uniref:Replication protein A subunit n=1 Tax=Taxus chinensis TaxID=29808 RepID=A0AA38CBT6_TAXCH|nr:hypothetical protein KI387_040610 [Taxus chinensis]